MFTREERRILLDEYGFDCDQTATIIPSDYLRAILNQHHRLNDPARARLQRFISGALLSEDGSTITIRRVGQ